MNDSSKTSDRGQALIIVAFSMIVLLGIGALVVDLGLSRRRAVHRGW
jgi:hypothetical protein